MTRLARFETLVLACTTWALVACGGGAHTSSGSTPTHAEPSAEKARELPPASAAPRDVKLPPVVRTTLPNGFEINVVEMPALPVTYSQLVIRSGNASTPKGLTGLPGLVADMLEEGTKTRSSAKLAEDIEFLGADLWTNANRDTVHVGMRSLSEHLETAFELLADVTLQPAFRDDELKKLKKRELDRLTLSENEAGYLAQREFTTRLFGAHPYGLFDTTKDVLRKVSRTDLAAWHKKHVVPSNAFLVVVGAVKADAVNAVAAKWFGGWSGKAVTPQATVAPPPRAAREIVLVDRPDSEQSVILVGNLGLPRSSPDYVPLLVANQVLGGGASSRLFMDLREKRSLTYGTYSDVGETLDVGEFVARGNVRNAVTKEAVGALFEHLERIAKEAPPEAELKEAERYLTDRFPLQIDTPGRVLSLVTELRMFGLPDDYWDTYRSSIAKVTASEALGAAAKYITLDRALVVVVGKADVVLEPLKAFGPVTVVDRQGKPKK